MLTRDLAISQVSAGQVLPDQLTKSAHSHYVELASRMVDVYRFGTGKTRRLLHSEVESIFHEVNDCPPRRVQAFCKLLDDESEFHHNRPSKVAELRIKVFREAARFQPLVSIEDALFDHNESDVKRFIASQLGKDWPTLRQELFADLIENHTLVAFDALLSPTELLARYNVAQYQAALFDATQAEVIALSDYRAILKYAKLARLMHRITREKDHYRFLFDGPTSILKDTRRYGVALAKFLPGLLSCRNWSLTATLRPHRMHSVAFLELNSQSGLKSKVDPMREFDSSLELEFATSWGDEPRNSWSLHRETEILHHGQHTFFPDFVLKHDNGKRVFLEIVGYWTPEYLQQKSKTLNLFRDHPILVAVCKSKTPIPALHPSLKVISFEKSLSVASVLDALTKY